MLHEIDTLRKCLVNSDVTYKINVDKIFRVFVCVCVCTIAVHCSIGSGFMIHPSVVK